MSRILRMTTYSACVCLGLASLFLIGVTMWALVLAVLSIGSL